MGYIFNYSKLKGKIKEKLNNQNNFSKLMELSDVTIGAKLNGKIEFKQSEIINACKILEIPENEINVYFFCIDS